MQKNSRISIVMPARNTEKYLPDCLDSILNQSEKNWELLVVNDHSTDGTFAILEAYSQKDQRIKVFQNKERGIIAALRLAYSKSSGNFITRMDADDLMSPDKLTILKKNLLEAGEGTVSLGFVKYFSASPLGDGYRRYAAWLNEQISSKNIFTEVYRECVIPSPCWLLFRSDFENIDAFNPATYPEDYDMCLRLYAANFKHVFSSEILHHWRDYGERTSRNDENYADNRFLDLKIAYFLRLENTDDKELILWGAGKKGKTVAQQLTNQKVAFRWLCNNERKIGKDIYGTILESTEILQAGQNCRIIVLVSQPEARLQIIAQLNEMGYHSGVDYFLFC